MGAGVGENSLSVSTRTNIWESFCRFVLLNRNSFLTSWYDFHSGSWRILDWTMRSQAYLSPAELVMWLATSSAHTALWESGCAGVSATEMKVMIFTLKISFLLKCRVSDSVLTLWVCVCMCVCEYRILGITVSCFWNMVDTLKSLKQFDIVARFSIFISQESVKVDSSTNSNLESQGEKFFLQNFDIICFLS